MFHSSQSFSIIAMLPPRDSHLSQLEGLWASSGWSQGSYSVRQGPSPSKELQAPNVTLTS